MSLSSSLRVRLEKTHWSPLLRSKSTYGFPCDTGVNPSRPPLKSNSPNLIYVVDLPLRMSHMHLRLEFHREICGMSMSFFRRDVHLQNFPSNWQTNLRTLDSKDFHRNFEGLKYLGIFPMLVIWLIRVNIIGIFSMEYFLQHSTEFFFTSTQTSWNNSLFFLWGNQVN